MGFAMKSGGLCTYAAALQMVREHRFERLMAFLSAAAWAALFVVPMVWAWPEGFQLGKAHQQWGSVIAGGLLLGLGAYCNRGCVFGTFVQLTGGNMTYLATLIGMVVGAVVAKAALSDIAPVPVQLPVMAAPGMPATAWLLFAALLVLWHGVRFAAQADAGRHWRSMVSAIMTALTLGVGGGALFATVNGWDFTAVMLRSAYVMSDLTTAGPTGLAVLSTLAMVAGGVSAAVSQQRFDWRAPELIPAVGSLAGGVLMGAAAVILPGGNDGLLLSGIPALAPHALGGFGMMLLSMLLLLSLAPNDKGFSLSIVDKMKQHDE